MRVLITGAGGLLGRHLVRQAQRSGHTVIAWGSPPAMTHNPAHLLPIDLTDPVETAHAFWEAQPMAVIHAAALARLGDCQRDPEAAWKINVDATRQLVGLCVAGVARLVYVSTDMVFDGSQGNYGEGDAVRPLSVYARTKVAAEKVVLIHPGHLVARLSLLVGCGSGHQPNFLDQQIQDLRENRPVALFEDEWRTPLAVQAAAEALISLAQADCAGVLHLGGPQRMSRYEMGMELAKMLAADERLVQKRRQGDLPGSEFRPRDVSLNSRNWRALLPHGSWPDYQTALRQALLGNG
jgi:dTDP-4-dehydrorhamnose reductase